MRFVMLFVAIAACSQARDSEPKKNAPGTSSSTSKPADRAGASREAAPAQGTSAHDAGSQAVATEAAAPEATGEEQSFLEGMQALCKSIDEVPANPDAMAYQRSMAAWIGANVRNQEVRELFTIIGDMPPAQRPGMLSAAAAKAGLPHCPLAER